jgi:hypothetical protein
MTMAAPLLLRERGTPLDNYHVIDLIGEGSFGKVRAQKGRRKREGDSCCPEETFKRAAAPSERGD